MMIRVTLYRRVSSRLASRSKTLLDRNVGLGSQHCRRVSLQAVRMAYSSIPWFDLLIPSHQDSISIYVPPPQILAFSGSTGVGYANQSIIRYIREQVRHVLRWLWEAFIVSTRTTEVAIRFSPLVILSPAAALSKSLLNDKYLSDLAWWYSLVTLQALGPAWQKLGQWAATRRDLFPQYICDRLSLLHDHGFAHSWKHTEEMLLEAFGEDYLARGLEIDALIGCGSAAQVYRGSLTVDGDRRPVAVKVLHPRFASLVERDLVLMQSAANLLNSLPISTIKVLDLPKVAQNFGDILRRQADLRIEARNLQVFRQNFYATARDEANSLVLFPKPVDEWTSSNILVEELVEDARPIAYYINDTTEEGWKIRKELALPLLRSFLKMVFIDSWVHADLHPGNVMVRTTTHRDGKVKRCIVFLDAGIATSLGPVEQKNLIDLFRAVILNDGYMAGKLLVERAKHERCSEIEGGVDNFSRGVAELVSEFHDNRKNGLTLGAVRIGSLLSRVLDLCRVYKVELDPAMASIILSTLVLEGLGRSLHPDLDLLHFAVPFVLNRTVV